MDIAIEQDDVRNQIHITDVVATEDGSHMIASVARAVLDIEEYLYEAIGVNAVTTAKHILDVSTIVATINGDVNKDVGLDWLVSWITICAMLIIVSAVAATVNGVDIRRACDSDVGVDFLV